MFFIKLLITIINNFSLGDLLVLMISYTILTRGRAVAARGAHNPEVGGSNPPPATKQVASFCCLSQLFS